MQRGTTGRMRTAWLALATTLALSGCTIPIVNVEVPFELPDLSGINLPLPDISQFNIPKFTLPVGVTASVDEARASALSAPQTVDDAALVTPGYLTVGIKPATTTAPLCLVGDAGELSGMDIDIAAALASEMGLRVRYVTVVDGASLGSECDIIMNGRTDNPDQIAIVGTYVESATSFFHKGEAVVSAATDLGGKAVGVQTGSVSETALNSTALKMSQQAFANLNEAFDALDAGQIDYVLCEAYPGAYLASLHKGISFAGTLETPVTSGVAVLTPNTELVNAVGAAFDAISENGVLQVARTRWVGGMPTLTTDSQIQNVPQPKKAEAPAVTQTTDEGSDDETIGDVDADADGSEAGAMAITNV